MIDFARIKQQRTKGRIAIELLRNSPQLLFMLYGLFCLATLNGKMLLPARRGIHRSLHLVPVTGAQALLAGWEYLGIGLFLYFSDGNPPGENRGWLWRLGRSLLRWGALAVALYCFVAASGVKLGSSPALGWLPPFLLVKIIAFIVGALALLAFLRAMIQREQVKRDLNERRCQPLRIWWIPAAYWIPWGSYFDPTGFRVIYSDPAGTIHRGYCFVYRSFLKNPRWGKRSVRWLTDTVTGDMPASEI